MSASRYATIVKLASRVLWSMHPPRWLSIDELAHDVATVVMMRATLPRAEDPYVAGVARRILARAVRRPAWARSCSYLDRSVPAGSRPVADAVADRIDAAAVLRHDRTGLLRAIYVEGYSFAETQGSLTHASHVVRVKRERLRARQALLFSEDRT